MKCDEKTILDYFEGDLGESRTRHLHRHLESCAECRLVFDQYKQLFDIMDFRSSGVNARKPLENRWQVPKWVAIAAILVIGLLGIGAAMLVQLTAFQYRELTVMHEQVRDLSSVVMLNAFDRLPASHRMQALEALYGQEELTVQEADLLKNTLKQDENLNVRSSAVRILAEHMDRPEIREVLYETLLNQQDPFIQVTLIRSFSRNSDADLIRVLRQLSASGQVRDEVKEAAGKVLDQYQ